MQKYVKNEKRYRLINFICLLAVYKKLIGTCRVLGTSILQYALSSLLLTLLRIEKSRQRSGTEAIRTRIRPSKLKRGITKLINSQNTKRAYGQPNEQLFPKRWPLSNPNRAKNNMNTRKVKRHRNSDTKTGNREPQQNYRLGTVSN